MPAYELEDKIGYAVRRVEESVKALTEDYEIIVVDDGSKDGTYHESLRNAKNPNVKVLRHETNMGKGAAIKTGIKKAAGLYTILLDADMDIDPEGMKFLIDGLENHDLIVCSKRHPRSIYRAPFIRKFLSLSFNTLVKLLTGMQFGDTQTGFKAFRTKALKRIMDVIVVKRFAYDVEVLAVANMLNLRVLEAPVHIEQKTMFSMKAVMPMLVDVLGIVYRLRIIGWYQKNLKQNSTHRPMIPLQ